MATYRAIAATSASLRHLLREATAGVLSESQVQLFQAADFRDPKKKLGNDEGLSLYLYRVGFNTGQRNLYPRVRPDGSHARPPLVVDLHYLLVAWSKEAERQQDLLAKAMLSFEERPSLPSGLLNGVLNEAVFRGEETVELIAENVSLQDLGTIWEVAKTDPQPSATYLVRMLALDPDAERIEAPEVQTRVFELVEP